MLGIAQLAWMDFVIFRKKKRSGKIETIELIIEILTENVVGGCFFFISFVRGCEEKYNRQV